MTTLLISSRHTDDNQALWRAATQRDWTVERVNGIRIPSLDDPEIVLYVESLFATTVARSLGRRLLDLPEDWLVKVPYRFTKRQIELMTLGEARNRSGPMFVKPPNDKSFAARVYKSGDDLPIDFENEQSVLVADPVRWEAEYRCFCLEGRVKACSPYLRSGELAKQTDYAASLEELSAASEFAELVLASPDAVAPKAIVLDVGQIIGQGWAVVEANAAWGSGIYGCDPDAVLDVIRHATAQPVL